MRELIRIREPTLLFAFGQAMEDPRDGLTLFGPLDEGRPYGIRAGVVGHAEGRKRFLRWVGRIQSMVTDTPPRYARPAFPGFESAFHIPWMPTPFLELDVNLADIKRCCRISDPHKRVYDTVSLYANPIRNARLTEDAKPDVWFVIIPDIVHQYCRPQSTVEVGLRVEVKDRMSVDSARRADTEPFLFPEETRLAVPYQYELNFHNQLKGRLLDTEIPTQIIRESTVAHTEFLNSLGRPKRALDPMQSAIAWNICTTAFYKAGGRPWKISGVREGVCYVGLVFKETENKKDPCSACCAAQMFLDSGDGVVFKGNVGPWYVPTTKDFHLTTNAAFELMDKAISSYKTKHGGSPPSELFVHGKVRFQDPEWAGFCEAAGSKTKVVGVRIVPEKDLKLYRKGDQPILRGLAHVRDERTAYLWTKGYVPRLRTYPGREVPNPLLVDMCRGEGDIRTILADIMALTKLNYNACIYADGIPVTLRFANAVGEILTSGPQQGGDRPLPFKYYI